MGPPADADLRSYQARREPRPPIRRYRVGVFAKGRTGLETRPTTPQSVIDNLISSLFALSSGAYIAEARVGSALNLPGISARKR